MKELSAAIQSEIILQCQEAGWCVVEQRQIDEAFPHPQRPTLAEIDDMLVLALIGNVPPPAEEPTQDEKISQFCESHGLRATRQIEKNTIRFDSSDIPNSIKDILMGSIEECLVGQMVPAELFHKEIRDRNFVETTIPTLDSENQFCESGSACSVAAKVITFEKLTLCNGSHVYRRIS